LKLKGIGKPGKYSFWEIPLPLKYWKKPVASMKPLAGEILQKNPG
jgi:hypothetical protein